MKKFIFLLITIATFATTVNAQSFHTRNVSENFKKYVSTSDATATTIDNVSVDTSEAGIIEFKVIGYDQADVAVFNSKKSYRYEKAANGTLTITGPVDSSQTVTTALSGSAASVTNNSNNLKLSVTGKAGKSVKWVSIVKQYFYKP